MWGFLLLGFSLLVDVEVVGLRVWRFRGGFEAFTLTWRGR